MTTATNFKEFLNNLKIDNADTISLRYEEITACLNKKFRSTESKTANSLQVGSYGRWTAIKGISDLDMLYIMPKSEWITYKAGKQSQLLTDTKDAIKARYPKTKVYVDRLVVRVLYQSFHIEVQPVFEQDDGSFKFPDTYNGGSWKITKPREEISAMKEFLEQKNKNLRRLCKMTRSWKNKCGLAIGGLLVDTLVYNFLKSSNDYDNKSFLYYDQMCTGFFKYLTDLPIQDHYKALGSGQNVNVKTKFQTKAKKAYKQCLKAIESEGDETCYKKWKKIFGRAYPATTESKSYSESYDSMVWDDTEEYIEDLYPVDIRYSIKIDCDVLQDGFLQKTLRVMLSKRLKLSAKKKLKFKIVSNNIHENFELYWKTLNRGREAKRRNCIRGQIVRDDGYLKKTENTLFTGEHIVECYAVVNGVVIARDSIDVPIN